MDPRIRPLEQAHRYAVAWLESLEKRPMTASATADEIAEALGTELPQTPTDPAEVVELLATACEPGLTAMPSGRFYGMVIGGSHPAALAADWLTAAWDQNAGLRTVTPAAAAAEEVAASWLLDLLGLPADAGVGFPTGATTANVVGLLCARDRMLGSLGWDVAAQGLIGAPRLRVLVGAEAHESVRWALRYLGLGEPEVVDADAEGRINPGALATALRSGGPAVVVLQAGNVHSGAFDPFGEAIAAAHEAGAWVHVDGAFGLFAAAAPSLRHLTAGIEAADSWTTDAHKTLNVPYDCGIAIVRDRAVLRQVLGKRGAYLIHDEAGEPFDSVLEMSRRARGFTVWAVLRALGRDGVAGLVDGFHRRAAEFAEGVRAIPGAAVLNEVDYTQVCATFGDDERTREVVRRVLADGTAWIAGSQWHGRAVLRISVSNWATTSDDVRRSLSALHEAVRALDGAATR